jgi:hypothetical protein
MRLRHVVPGEIPRGVDVFYIVGSSGEALFFIPDEAGKVRVVYDGHNLLRIEWNGYRYQIFDFFKQ